MPFSLAEAVRGQRIYAAEGMAKQLLLQSTPVGFHPGSTRQARRLVQFAGMAAVAQLAARRSHVPRVVTAIHTCPNLAIPRSASRHGQRVSYFEPTPSRLKENIHTFASRGNAWRKLCCFRKPLPGTELRTLTSQD